MSVQPHQPFHDVRMRGFKDRMDVDAVLALLKERLSPLGSEEVGPYEAAGRVLAADAFAAADVPAFDRAAMDGYALRGEETFGAGLYNPLTFLLVGEALPNQPFVGTVNKGECVRVMTGAPMPDGADAVVPAEHAVATDGTVAVTEPVPPRRHVMHRGEDLAAGAKVLEAGRVLRPQDAAVLAAIRLKTIRVISRPRVRILVTGDELVPPGMTPGGCQIVDVNSVMLAALVRRDGGQALLADIVPDRRDAVRAALLGHAADVVLVSGGSSVGVEDHAPLVLAELGELAVHGVAMRPSSPAGVGFLGTTPVFLLPGNPVSCLAAYEFFAGPAIRRLGGRSFDWPHRRRRLPLARKLVSAIGRVDYVRVAIRDDKVEPLATSGASILSSTVRADGCVIVDRDREGFGPGETVEVLLYDD